MTPSKLTRGSVRSVTLLQDDKRQSSSQATDAYAIDPAARATVRSSDWRIVMHLETGRICALNAMASEIWTLLERGLTLNEIVDELSSEYDASRSEVERGVRAFVRSLEERGLARAQGVRTSLSTTGRRS